MVTIRNEEPRDYERVEQLTREAFYNLYMPGCVEHYLVHTMRTHEDFVPELDYVLEQDGEVVGYIMYTRATLTDEAGQTKGILTFGPLCIAPDSQRRGYGKQLMRYSFERAVELGYDTVVSRGSWFFVSAGYGSWPARVLNGAEALWRGGRALESTWAGCRCPAGGGRLQRARSWGRARTSSRQAISPPPEGAYSL